MEAKDSIWCKSCGVEITWGAYIVNGQHYCCKDCFEGLPCQCAERMELDEEYRAPAAPF